ncbi:MAG: phosphoenolpyruvate synthase [Patescibacteria group bacterium]
MTKNIVWFKEVGKGDVGLVGGKGANLGELTRAGLPVPPGFIVTSTAYFNFLKSTNLDITINKLLKNLDVNNSKELNKTASNIQKEILSEPMPKSLESEISAAYKKLYTTQASSIFVAVRSSATAEDLPSVSEDEQIIAKINDRVVFSPIKDIYRRTVDSDGNLACKVRIPSMKDGRITWKKVSNFYRHPVNNKKLYKIKTATGREITISSNHSALILDNETLLPKTIAVENIRDGRVPCIKKLPNLGAEQKYLVVKDYVQGADVVEKAGYLQITNQSMNWSIQHSLSNRIIINGDLLYFLGIYVAEGCTYKNNCVVVTSSNLIIRRRIMDFLRSLGLYHNQKINKGSIRVYCKSLVRLLHELTGKPTAQIGKGRSCSIKKVPDFVFSLNEKLIGEFLQGCFDGDGGVDTSLSYTSTSPLLIGGIVKLLERLGLRFSLTQKNNSQTIYILHADFKNFQERVNFSHPNKKEKLQMLVEQYMKKSNHQEFKENIDVSKTIAYQIRQKFIEGLPQEQRYHYRCQKCQTILKKSGCYKNRLRFYCQKCHHSFYLKQVNKEKIKTHIWYDAAGRFLKGAAPWNKGLITGRLSKNRFKQILDQYHIRGFDRIFDRDVLWDEIKEVKPVEYCGDVYDFSVPGNENFAAGLGGIFTHNSASFAGQQKTFLNVSGSTEVVKAVKMSWASLFEARAIYYRKINNFDHMKVGIAIPIQKMIQSEKSGIMFTINPVDNDKSKIVIEAGFGLGEAIVSGSVTPDRYVVNKEDQKIEIKEVNVQPWKIAKVGNADKHVSLLKNEQKLQKLSDEEIKRVAEFGRQIENHYHFPQDTEWAIEGKDIYFVQSRPITTIDQKSNIKNQKGETPESGQEESKANVILKGLAASIGLASGPVKIIHSPDQIDEVKKGDVLVTEMTSPDYVPAMKKAAAIVTDTGGQTSHAAIVSRELGIPCVVGSGTATHTLTMGQVVSVDGAKGLVYKGKVSREEAPAHQDDMGGFAEEVPITATKVYVNLGEPSAAEKVAKLPCDGVGLMRAEFMIAEIGKHPRALVNEGKTSIYISKLEEGLLMTCQAFFPRPVVYRATDFKTNEYRNLEGGKDIEPVENNPMIGYRGASRYIREPDLFKLELEAIKKVRKNSKNLWLMIPFVRTIDELRKVKALIADSGLKQGPDFRLWMMCEIPSNVILINKFIEEGIDGISIGSNDLTQLTLGIDRDNETMAAEFDERDEAVTLSIAHVIKACRAHNITCSICGQAATTYPEIAELMVKEGATSVSVSPDSVVKTRKLIASVEKKIMLSDIIDKE